MKRIVSLLVLLLGIGAVSAAETTVDGTVRSIYLGDFGHGLYSELIKEKVRARLVLGEWFDIVDAREDADAILLGAGSIHGDVESAPDSAGTAHKGYGAFRLVDPESQETIWTWEYKRDLGYTNPSGEVARKLVKSLVKHAGTAKEDKS